MEAGAADEIVELGEDVVNIDVEVSLGVGRLPGGPGLGLQAAGEVSEHLRWLGQSLLQLLTNEKQELRVLTNEKRELTCS